MTDNYTGITENPEYQKMHKKLMGVRPEVRAIIDPNLADDAYIADYLNKQYKLSELGLAKQAGKENLAQKEHEAKGTLNLAALKSGNDLATQRALFDINRDKFYGGYGLESGLGLQTLADAYRYRLTTLRTNLDNINNQNLWSNLIGAGNVGMSLYGASEKDKYNEELLKMLKSGRYNYWGD